MSYEFGQTVPHGAAPQTTDMLIALLLGQMADELDHPEVWRAVPDCIARFPDFRTQITARFNAQDGRQEHLLILHALALAADDDLPTALAEIAPLAVIASQSALVQGAVFHLQSLGDPENPRYHLEGKICTAPFQQLDVLENSAHQYCARWLHQSAGDLSAQPWREVWNSAPARRSAPVCWMDHTVIATRRRVRKFRRTACCPRAIWLPAIRLGLR